MVGVPGLLLVGLAIATAPVAKVQSPPATVCSAAAVALSYEAQQLGPHAKLALIDEEYRSEAIDAVPAANTVWYLQQRQTNEHRGWTTTPPSSETISALWRAPASDAVRACSAIRIGAEKLGVTVVPGTARFRASPKTHAFSATLIRMGLPVVNAAGTEALVAFHSASGPLAGGGEILLLRRPTGGDWRLVETSQISIS